MRKQSRGILLLLIAILGVWTVYQFVDTLRGKEPAGDAKVLLYEASLFQVELLEGSASLAGTFATTGDLDELKQAAYSVDYTHGKLVKAWGKRLPELGSAGKLVEWIVRVQIGGERELKAEEKELLSSLSPLFQHLHRAYSTLLTNEGQLIGSAADEMAKVDKEIVKLLGTLAK